MRRAGSTVLGVVVLGTLTAAPVSATAPPPEHRSIVGMARTSPAGDAMDLLGSWSDAQGARRTSAPRAVAEVETEQRFARVCGDAERAASDTGADCLGFGFGPPGALSCDEGQTPRAPRWTRSRVLPSGAWSEWSLQDYGACVGPDAAVPVLTAEDFRRLPLPAPTLHVQPDGDWVLVNVETIVYTDPSPVTLTTDLLGHEVTVEATPREFTYDWGDGHSTTTRDAGRPYPALDVVHRYEQPGRVAITLTTQWTGRYRVAGDAQWRDVTGTAQTSVTGPALDVEERTSRLVSGTCRQQPDAPGCAGSATG
ncbi:hypothetical protein [Cellulomonas iranensis]|nr:hypothetical protein [Cellulomonas iranensis]